jgi:pimeloyl-ACP methyl ester carboxylesterase
MPQKLQAEIDGHLVSWLRQDDANVLYVHGVPDSSRMWIPFLERTGGIALDLPGFGRSGKRADFPYGIEGYADFLGRFVERAGLERVRLVCHDWGGVALAWAMREPERVERLVAIDVVPFLPGYRWHRVARLWRRRVLGELAMGATNRHVLRLASGMGGRWAREVMEDFDQGTQRAILKLYRSAPEHVLARAGEHLGKVRCPALVIAPAEDPYIPAQFGRAYADALGGDTRLVELERAGHWPWLDRPELVEEVAGFLAAERLA